MKSKHKLSKRERSLMALSILAAAIAVFKYGYSSKRTEDFALSTKISELQQAAASDMLKATQLAATRVPATTTIGDKKIPELLEQNSHFTSFVRNLAGDDQNLEIKRITSEKVEKSDGSSLLVYSVIVKSPYLAIMKFVNKIEESPLMVEVQSVDFSKDSEEIHTVIGKLTISNLVAKE